MGNYKFRISPFVFMLLSACGLRSQNFDQMVDDLLSRSVEVIYPDSLQKIMEDRKLKILDARERSEFDVSHIKGAEWVGYDDFELNRVKADKNDEIIVYCSVGYRSEKVGEKLKDAGYKNVHNLYGGIFGWKNDGNDVVDSNGHATEKVHAYNKSWGKWLTSGEKVLDE